MTLTVRRRAVCALALLALLCGCCCATAAAASSAEEEVDVSVQISCADSDNKLSWRFPGEGAWQKCAFTVDESFRMSGAIGDDENSLCAWAGAQYFPSSSASGSVCSGATAENAPALTMRCKTKKSSGAYKRSVAANKQPGGAVSAAAGSEPLGALTECQVQPPGEGAADGRGGVAPGGPSPPTAAASLFRAC
ncbi:mucin-like glycoprotein [Trypanosoma conorhini]|uniref:Mucin-like glycoprotein n=1 Tax=Trypanosoma conorhini TaxID=83891 RepID=A0A422N7Q9_9TRYP|nr:mucin-like glycoprotein [Trypanosoma conorhini]RNF01493.1 mucin-like glycoprotein [Trypanosoma conorhini]